MEELRLTRRASLARLGGFLAAALSAGGWRVQEAASERVGPAGVASGGVSCVLAPEQNEGPYYIADEKLRRNITEGKPGMPLTLELAVVDASTCRPIKGAVVDIWHADAFGVYSGFGQGSGNRTFLRGLQKTDAKGVATFRTVYPGWYRGRTVHIHVRVHLGGNVVHTGQLFFPETVTDVVYKKLPYRKRSGRDTRNAVDSVFRNGGNRLLLSLRRKKSAAGYVGTITMGVQRS